MAENINATTNTDRGKIVGEWFKKNMINAVHSFSSSITVVMILIPILISIIFRDPKGALITAGCIVNLVINLILKFTIKQKAVYSGDGNKKICTFFEDYEIAQNADSPATDFRMPSEHSQTIGFVMGFFIGKMIINQSFKTGEFFILLMITVIISWSRYNKKCHTMPQVVAGVIIGVSVGIGYYYLVKDCYENCGKDEESEQLCLASDDNEYKCDAIKDGYVVHSNEDKES
jgi:membrane-associated phospholipid phosphatase